MIETLISTRSSSRKIRASKEQVADFKMNWCNENEIIASLVRKRMYKHFISPVLDVGAGLGDIAYKALKGKDVICIDLNKITTSEYPLANGHTRLQKDFFEYKPEKKINTIFISHSLQYLDDNMEELNKKLKEIDAMNIIIVQNKNDDFIGKVVKWVMKNFSSYNPEVKIPGFPNNYRQIDSTTFKSVLTCDTFENLAEQISYLMEIDITEGTKRNELTIYLKKNMKKPIIEFNESIKTYTRNEKR